MLLLAETFALREFTYSCWFFLRDLKLLPIGSLLVLGIFKRYLIITIHSHPRSQQSVRHGQRERERESSANVRNVHEPCGSSLVCFFFSCSPQMSSTHFRVSSNPLDMTDQRERERESSASVRNVHEQQAT